MYPVVNRFLSDVFTHDRRVLVASDLDGTICLARPFEEPAPDPVAVSALRAIAATERARVVILSGRPIDSVARICADIEGAYLVGEHGAVIRDPDGRLIFCQPSAEVAARDGLRKRLRAFLPRVDGARIASRPRGVVLGLRCVDRARRSAVASVFHWLAAESGAQVIEGKHWLEARFEPSTKGEALETLLGWGGEDAVVCAGDDPTDDAAFLVARRAPANLVFHVGSPERPAARKVVDAVLPDRARWGEILVGLARGLAHESAGRRNCA